MRLGTDIIEISRIQKIILKYGDRFLKRIFTETEIKYCEEKKANKYKHYAARFASKEAVSKALGKGLSDGIKWTDIEIIRQKPNPPYVRLYGQAEKIARNMSVKRINISISHCNEYAVANVIVE